MSIRLVSPTNWSYQYYDTGVPTDCSIQVNNVYRKDQGKWIADTDNYNGDQLEFEVEVNGKFIIRRRSTVAFNIKFLPLVPPITFGWSSHPPGGFFEMKMNDTYPMDRRYQNGTCEVLGVYPEPEMTFEMSELILN